MEELRLSEQCLLNLRWEVWIERLREVSSHSQQMEWPADNRLGERIAVVKTSSSYPVSKTEQSPTDLWHPDWRWSFRLILLLRRCTSLTGRTNCKTYAYGFDLRWKSGRKDRTSYADQLYPCLHTKLEEIHLNLRQFWEIGNPHWESRTEPSWKTPKSL